MHKSRLAVGCIKNGCITLKYEKDGTIYCDTKPLSPMSNYNFIEVPDFVTEAGKRSQRKLQETLPMGKLYQFPKKMIK